MKPLQEANVTSARGLDVPAFHKVPPKLAEILRKLLGLEYLDELCSLSKDAESAADFSARALRSLDIEIQIDPEDFAKVPAKGPVILAANHPFGLLEGLVMNVILHKIRPDIRFLANSLLRSVPAVRDLVIPVDVFGGSAKANLRSALAAHRWLDADGLLVWFPAGEVSTWNWKKAGVTDPQWNPALARMARKTGATVVPAFFAGANSLSFQMLGMIHPSLRTVRLPAELLNKRGATIKVLFGKPVNSKRLNDFDPSQQTEYLRCRTYLLGFRRNRVILKSEEPTVSVVDTRASNILAHEIANLPTEQVLAESEEYLVAVGRARQMPALLDEVGRLREITFRREGEGTGQSRDLDTFDATYEHLVLWSKRNNEIAGGYRLCQTEHIVPRFGVSGLYTNTLFRYNPRFFSMLGPAVELGRSFVRAEYQQNYAPLYMLWKAIAQYVVKNPQASVLFGAVSMSNTYQHASRALLVEYLRHQSAHDSLRGLVKARNPFHPPLLASAELKSAVNLLRSMDDVSTAIADIEGAGRGVPVLVRQYFKMGARALEFNVDRRFHDALDCLIVLDLRDADSVVMRRLLGKQNDSAA